MKRYRVLGVLAATGATAALCTWSGAGGALRARWNSGGRTSTTALMQAKAQKSSVELTKSHRNPVGRLIPPDQLVAKSELDLMLGPLAPDVLDDSARLRSSGGRHAGRNVFVNDPCLDPPPTAPFPQNFLRTVQSETDIAVLNATRRRSFHDNDDDDDDGHGHGWYGRSSKRGGREHSGNGPGHDRGDHSDCDHDDDDDDDNNRHNDVFSGRLMVAGYNDSYGFYDNRQGISGFAYSTDFGRQWIDGGGLPPVVPSGAPAGTLGSDAYFGDPVVTVDHRARRFYYASIYLNPAGIFTLSVNRGKFKMAPQQVPVESKANTRCEGNPMAHGIPDPPEFIRERIIWEPPVEAVAPIAPDDFLDKEWLYVDQKTGFLYLTYTRFGPDNSTPLELVRSFDGGRTWTPPSIIVPNLLDTFNTATQVVVTPTGRVIVSWHASTFPAPAFVEREQRIEVAVSDDGGTTFGPPIVVARVNPQREPPGYNRSRPQILNVPYLAVDKGRDDGITTREERRRSGFGNVYLTYFSGRTPLAQAPAPPTTVFSRTGDILLSTSRTNGDTWRPPVLVNDDTAPTSHVFSSVQVNEDGEIFVTWLDRRLDPARNLLTDTWGDISDSEGRRTGTDLRITDVSTDWITREDAQPDFGDYNSSEVIGFRTFVSIWADGRFPTPAPLTQTPTGGFTRPANQAATPDSLMAIVGRRR
jgi:hypothetical protein